MSVLPSQTSISPQDIASGTAISFFLPAGGTPQPPPPSSISTLADIQVSSITFGDATGVFTSTGMSLYRTSASTNGSNASTILAVHDAAIGIGSVSVDSLALLQINNAAVTHITNTAGALNLNGELVYKSAGTLTLSTVTTQNVGGVPYVPQPLMYFGQGVIGGGGTVAVSMPGYNDNSYAVCLGGAQSTLLLAQTFSTFTVGGPAGSNFSWITSESTQ